MPYNSLISTTDVSDLIPLEETTSIFKSAIDESYAIRLGTRLPNMSRKQRSLKVQNTLPTVYGVNAPTGNVAGGLIQTTDVSWTDVVITAEDIAVMCVIDKDNLDDSAVPIWSEVRPAISGAIANWLDGAILFGTNAFASWPTDVRAAAVAAANTVALGAGVDIYDDVLGDTGMYSLVEADGFEITGNICATGIKARLRGCRDLNGVPIFTAVPGEGTKYQLDGAPCYFPTHGGFVTTATWMIAGDFSKLVYAFRQDVEWSISDQGVVQDGAGNIINNLWQQNQVALKMVFRFGWQLPNPINALQTTAAARCPFGVLTT